MLGRLHLLLPFALLGIVIGALHLSGDLHRFAVAAVASFFTLGKFVIILGGLPEETFAQFGLEKMSTLELAVMVFAMDMLYAYFLAFNLHHVYRIRHFGIGPAIERLQVFCRYWISDRPWMKRWAFTGVMLFVLFPLTGTGAPGGSILGRLVGLGAGTTLAAIALGSSLGCGLMAALANRLEPVFESVKDAWWFHGLGIAIIVVVVGLLFWLGHRLGRAAEEFASKEGS